MQFESYVPFEEPEASQYAHKVTIDGDGVDLAIDGETISASFQGQNNIDIAIALLDEEFAHTEGNVHLIQRMGGYTAQGMEDLGYAYLKASQLLRLNAEEPALV